MYTIGQIAKIAGISRDKLRYYEEKGIIAPSQDHENNYRKYDYKDILTILSVEFYRSLDIDFKTIKSIHGKSDIGDIESILSCKRDEVMKEIDRLSAIVRRIDSLKSGCEDIRKYLNAFSIRPFGPLKVLGDISDFYAFDEFDNIHRFRDGKNEEAIIKSLVRQINFNDTGLSSSKMLITEEMPVSPPEMKADVLKYGRCVYTIIEDKLQGENEMQYIFMNTRQWITQNGYKDIHVAFLRMILMEPREERSKSYLELFVPVE